MQQAFIDHDAFQCGYCTPGQIMSAVGCIQEGHAKTDAEIREYMSGNLCRCAAYPNIVAAIRQAKTEMERLTDHAPVQVTRADDAGRDLAPINRTPAVSRRRHHLA